MADLIGKLGDKTNSGQRAGKAPEPQGPSASAVASSNLEVDRGDDLLAKAASNKSDAGGANPPQAQASSAESGQNSPSASSTVEPSGGQNSNDWSTDSALKEVRKLREENKAYRLKYAEQLDKFKAESDARIQQKEAEMQALLDAKTELDKIKADQEDKKRDLAERIAHREARLAEMQTVMDAKEKDYKQRISQMETTVQQFKAEREAEAEVYKSRLNEELSKIPENYKEYASLLVKGAGDPRDALIALTEAKVKGMFEEKTVVVNHSVPGASDGARSSKERLEEAEKQRRTGLNSSQKIAEALKQVKSGTPNSAFRSK